MIDETEDIRRDRQACVDYRQPAQDHPSGLSGEHDVVLDAINEESLHQE